MKVVSPSLCMRVTEKSKMTQEVYLVPGAVHYDAGSSTLDFIPTTPLKPHTEYRVYFFGAAFEYTEPPRARVRKPRGSKPAESRADSSAEAEAGVVDDEERASALAPAVAKPSKMQALMSTRISLGDETFDFATGLDALSYAAGWRRPQPVILCGGTCDCLCCRWHAHQVHDACSRR
jgi:hypothetical protein